MIQQISTQQNWFKLNSTDVHTYSAPFATPGSLAKYPRSPMIISQHAVLMNLAGMLAALLQSTWYGMNLSSNQTCCNVIWSATLMSQMCSYFCFSVLKSLIIRYDKMVSHTMPTCAPLSHGRITIQSHDCEIALPYLFVLHTQTMIG